MKGIIYTRVSSDEQVKGTSLEGQEDLCRRYCETRGIEVAQIFREEGETAKDLSLNNRGQFLKALEYCRKHKGTIQAFVVLRVDRFARNTEDHFSVRKILMDYGVSLCSVTEPIGNKPAEKFIETVLAGAAEYDNAIRKQRCTDGMSKKIEQGIYPWKPPVGYRPQNSKKRGEKKTLPDPIHEDIFPLLQRALKEYAKGLFSMTQIASLLDDWGLPNFRGMKTSVQFVDKIVGLHTRFYAGLIYNPFTGKTERGLHRPMITEEEMHQIQLIRSGKVSKVKRDRFNPEFPLRRTVLCGICSTPITGSAPKGNGGTYSYYHCRNKLCDVYGKGVAKLKLETEFQAYLETLKRDERRSALFNATVIDLWNEKAQGLRLEVGKYEKQVAALEEKRKKIFDMFENNGYTKEEFAERKAAVDNEIAATRIMLNETRIDEFDVEAVVAYATNFLDNLGRQWFDLSPELRPRFQKLIFPEGIPYTRGIGFGTSRMSLFLEIKETHLVDESLLVTPARVELALQA